MPEFSISLNLGVTISRRLKESDVVALGGVEATDMGNGYVCYRLPVVTIEDASVSFILYFNKGVMESVTVRARSSETHAGGWSDWSEEEEKRCAEYTSAWLLKAGCPPGQYSWGEVWAGYDTKGASGYGVIRYAANV
ncbi:MAG: hypothetical protein MJA83_19090 [Gammaproteobacteria bacterium]|nr:hypothetical protein [Gammaproteobacteria bacterium]